MNPTDAARFDPHESEAKDHAARWIDATEAARLLGVSVRGVQRRCRAGKLAARLVSTPSGQQWEINAQTLTNGAGSHDTDDTQPATQTTRATEETTPNDTNDATRTTPATKAPDTDLNARYVAQIEAENRFLRAQIEEGNRNAAELRKALNEALKIAPRQLAAHNGSEGLLQTKSAVEGSGPKSATDQAQEPTRASEGPLTYADIADELERSLNR